MTNLLSTILWMSLGGTALGGVLLLIQRLCKNRLPSGFYYGAWLVVLLRFCLPIGGLLPTGQASDEQQSNAAMVSAEYADGQRTMHISDGLVDDVDPAEAEADSGETAEAAESETATAAAQAEPSAQEPLSDPGLDSLRLVWAWLKNLLASSLLWTALWAIGAALYLARYVFYYKRFTSRLRTLLIEPTWLDRMLYDGIPATRRPRLARCRHMTTPMLLGVFHPLIVLPDREYAPARLENILRHELTHHQRRDILFKWLAVACCALHWFNPFMLVLRHKLDQTCELSCDARLLRHMDASQKQAYGETLLDLAADRSLPAGVVATTFATEKRTLKERLKQIMTYKKKTKTAILLILAAALALCACGMIIGPRTAAATDTENDAAQAVSQTVSTDAADTAASDTTAAAASNSSALTQVTVSTVDEFLAAIAPNTMIVLEPGTYDLTTAADYGTDSQSEYYTWGEVYDGYELVISDVSNLTIQAVDDGSAAAKTTEIDTQPRYADVIEFDACTNIEFFGITAGHTPDPASCSGGVLHFASCTNVNIESANLYGCGIIGIQAENCQGVYASDTTIYECSYGAVWASYTNDLQLKDCTFRDCPGDDGGLAGVNSSMVFSLFQFTSCSSMAIVNCEITDCNASVLLDANYSQDVYLLGTAVSDCFVTYLINAQGHSPIIDSCSFTNIGFQNDYFDDATAFADMAPVSLDGTELTWNDLLAMTRADVTYEGPAATETPELDATENANGTREVTVSTVDELLAAIGPDTTIYLEAGDYNLYEAADYGSYGSTYYYWQENYDGPGLVITCVSNLTIVGAGKDETTIQAQPRYADVILFSGCENISLSGFTAGHVPIADTSCSGGVLNFTETDNIEISACGLYGCGILGVQAYECDGLQVTDTEIYDCSNGAALITNCENVAFTNCDVHDCCTADFYTDGSLFRVYVCSNVSFDGCTVSGYGSVNPYDAEECTNVTVDGVAVESESY